MEKPLQSPETLQRLSLTGEGDSAAVELLVCEIAKRAAVG